jgi:14-3-3 protein epsilon
MSVEESIFLARVAE